MNRIVCHFSCGAASAIATKLALAEYGPANMMIINAFIKEEHPDNRRFCTECGEWFGHPITILRDERYGASTDEVWRRKRYIKGMYGAPCSRHLKRELLDAFSQPDDVFVLGFTSEEQDRLDRFHDANNGRRVICPLIDRNLSKADCLAIIERTGIKLPQMYLMGYDNANCIGCPKGGQNYWRAIREDFPERFAAVKAIQDAVGPGAYFLQHRSGPKEGERMSLAQLPAGRGDVADEPSFECSLFCLMAEQDMEAA